MPDNLDFRKTIADTFTTNKRREGAYWRNLWNMAHILWKKSKLRKSIWWQILWYSLWTVRISYEPLVVECFDRDADREHDQKKDARTQLPLGEGFRFEIRVAEDITDPMGNIHTMEIEGSRVELKKGHAGGGHFYQCRRNRTVTGALPWEIWHSWNCCRESFMPFSITFMKQNLLMTGLRFLWKQNFRRRWENDSNHSKRRTLKQQTKLLCRLPGSVYRIFSAGNWKRWWRYGQIPKKCLQHLEPNIQR